MRIDQEAAKRFIQSAIKEGESGKSSSNSETRVKKKKMKKNKQREKQKCDNITRE